MRALAVLCLSFISAATTPAAATRDAEVELVLDLAVRFDEF